jgi:hypothetical protein
MVTYTPVVNPTTGTPTAHMDLYDGIKHMQFIIYNNKGKRDKTGLIRNNAKQTPFVAVFGNIKYDDENAPYGTMIQQDWSGGRGQEDFETDSTRYYDATGIDSINGGDGLILNGLPTYATGFHTVQEDWGANVTWRGLYDTTLYLSEKFTTASAWNTDTVTCYAWARIRKAGSPTSNLYFKVYSNSSNKPNAVVLASGAIPYTQVADTLGVVIQFTLATGTDLATSTAYHVVIYADANGTAANHWEVGCDATSTTSCISSNGSTWTVTTGYAPHYRFFLTTDKTLTTHFFEYKGGLYLATQPDDGTSGKLYRNGWRGACDSNSGDLSFLNDSSAPGFAADELIGCIAKTTEGDAARVNRTWRPIVDNTTTAIEVSPDWDVAQTILDSYVIIGSNKWNLITSTYLGSDIFTQPISDVAVTNGIVYMTNQKESTRVEKVGAIKFHEYNGAGTWQTEFGPTGVEAQHLKVVYDETLGPMLWLSRINYDDEFFSDLQRVVAPIKWSTNELLSGAVIEKCDDTWNESDLVTGVTISQAYNYAVGFTFTDVFTTGIIASEVIASTDVRPFNKISFRIHSSVSLEAGVLQIVLDNTAKCVSATVTADIPALSANVWRTVDLDITTSVAGAEAIISVGLNCTVDQNKTVVIYIQGPVCVYNDYAPILVNNRINSMEAYGAPQTLWVINEDEIGYISNGRYVPSEIKGLKPLAGEENGRAHVADDVYMYFNIGNDMQRFYSQSLYDISIYKGAGLPSNRVATPVCAVAYKDRVYIAYDGGYSNYSYVMCYHGDSDHEVFRAPIVGNRIRSLYIQPIPGSNTDRLWISMGADVLWIPVSANPYADPDYRYTNEGSIETSWIYGERRDIKKFFKSIKLFMENVLASSYYVQADYKLDGATSWTAISNDFDAIEEEVDFSSSSPPTSTGKRLRIRLRFYTNDSTKTPRLKQMGVRGVGYAKQKFQYSCYFKMQEGDANEDLEGDIDTIYASVDEQLQQLDTWADEITPILMRTVQTPFDNKIVFVLPGSTKGTFLDVEETSGSGREAYFGYVTLLEA